MLSVDGILSIDSELSRGVIVIFLGIQSKKRDVAAFLEDLRSLLENERFDVDSDLTLIIKNKADDEEHSTYFALLDLNYTASDVADRLRELTVAEYSETKLDTDDTDPLLLYVFGKVIGGREVYIKLKIKGCDKRRIICVSFHYAKYPMTFPYS